MRELLYRMDPTTCCIVTRVTFEQRLQAKLGQFSNFKSEVLWNRILNWIELQMRALETILVWSLVLVLYCKVIIVIWVEIGIVLVTYPRGHFMHVGSAMMVVENDNGENDWGGDHEHDTIEVRSCQNHHPIPFIRLTQILHNFSSNSPSFYLQTLEEKTSKFDLDAYTSRVGIPVCI